MQYFHRWKKYNEEATQVLQTRGRDAFISLLRADAGKRIYKVIPVDSTVREKSIQLFASHPIEEYRRGMLEFGSSVPISSQPFASSTFQSSACAAATIPILTGLKCWPA